MHHTRRSLSYVFLIITVIVSPTAIALGWYQYTRDPTVRPLGITRDALRQFGVFGTGGEIVAYVDWPPGAGQTARKRLADNLRMSFASKGVDVRLVFREAGGPVRVTYVIGNSVLGPYSSARAAEGVGAAVEAYRMH